MSGRSNLIKPNQHSPDEEFLSEIVCFETFILIAAYLVIFNVMQGPRGSLKSLRVCEFEGENQGLLKIGMHRHGLGVRIWLEIRYQRD